MSRISFLCCLLEFAGGSFRFLHHRFSCFFVDAVLKCCVVFLLLLNQVVLLLIGLLFQLNLVLLEIFGLYEGLVVYIVFIILDNLDVVFIVVLAVLAENAVGIVLIEGEPLLHLVFFDPPFKHF